AGNAPLLRRGDRSDRKQERAGLHAARRALDPAREQKRDEDPRACCRAHRSDGGEEAGPDVHPDARSTSRTSSGARPGGVISNVNAQCPTITSAGADFSYVPGATSRNEYACCCISMSSMSNFVTTTAPRTGLPPRVTRTLKVSGSAARFGEMRTATV